MPRVQKRAVRGQYGSIGCIPEFSARSTMEQQYNSSKCTACLADNPQEGEAGAPLTGPGVRREEGP